MARHWTPGAHPAPSPRSWSLNMSDGLEARVARTLFVRANRCRNEIEQAKSREETQEAAVRFLLNARQITLTLGKPIYVQMMVALLWLGSITTDLFAFECNVIARELLKRQRKEA
jgi:hypothetical protein